MTAENVRALTAELMSPTWSLLRSLDSAIALNYQDRNNDVGSASITLPAGADLDAVTSACHVRFSLGGDVVFGARVRAESMVLLERDVEVTIDLLGLLGAVLSDAVVLDESGNVRANSTGQRWFGWMSTAYDDTGAGWITTLAASSFRWDDEAANSDFRLGNPINWPDPLAWWVHRGSFGGQFQLWRKTFTLDADSVLGLWASADEGIRVYFDGELVLDVLGTNAPDETGYLDPNFTPLGIVEGGAHHIAFEFRSKITPIAGDSFDGAILTVGKIDANGAYLENVVRTDDSGTWRSYGGTWESDRPGLNRAAAMIQLWDEAVARGVLGPSFCQLGFTADLDSAGVAWDDYDLNEAADLAQVGYDQVFLGWADGKIDLGMDASTTPPTFNAWKRRGTDRTATVFLKRGSATVKLSDGANVTDLRTGRDHNVVTTLWAQLNDQTYVTSSDSAASAAYGGVIERGVALGNVAAGAGQRSLDEMLAETKDHTDSLDIGQALTGSEPYTDYAIGDTITTPQHRGGTGPARCLGITADQPKGADYADVTPMVVPQSEEP